MITVLKTHISCSRGADMSLTALVSFSMLVVRRRTPHRDVAKISGENPTTLVVFQKGSSLCG